MALPHARKWHHRVSAEVANLSSTRPPASEGAGRSSAAAAAADSAADAAGSQRRGRDSKRRRLRSVFHLARSRSCSWRWRLLPVGLVLASLVLLAFPPPCSLPSDAPCSGPTRRSQPPPQGAGRVGPGPRGRSRSASAAARTKPQAIFLPRGRAHALRVLDGRVRAPRAAAGGHPRAAARQVDRAALGGAHVDARGRGRDRRHLHGTGSVARGWQGGTCISTQKLLDCRLAQRKV
eukprot:scaffold7379_cov366-Prasinococcus_capsulatus_cf.AAC.6